MSAWAESWARMRVAEAANLAEPGRVLVFEVPGEPVPKARPRISTVGGVYTPRRTSQHTDRVAERWRIARLEANWKRLEEPVAVFAVFERAAAWHADGDNLLKLVLDAGTRAEMWTDDRLVHFQAALLLKVDADPCTVIASCPMRDPRI